MRLRKKKYEAPSRKPLPWKVDAVTRPEVKLVLISRKSRDIFYPQPSIELERKVGETHVTVAIRDSGGGASHIRAIPMEKLADAVRSIAPELFPPPVPTELTAMEREALR